MNTFRILYNRKRAIIALVHSLAFGFLAFYQLMANYHPVALIEASSGNFAGPAILTAIYFIVTTILLVLVLASRGAQEKLYFAFCATGAGVGLIRVVVGDPTAYAGNLIRVLMLGCAVIVGSGILRLHSEVGPEFAD